jgi:hypothetical protein
MFSRLQPQPVDLWTAGEQTLVSEAFALSAAHNFTGSTATMRLHIT